MNFVRVNGYPDYVIHPAGTVLKIWKNKTKRRKHCKTTSLKHCKDSTGYIVRALCKNGKMKTFKLHRLLAIAFIPNPENKPCIDHINGIRNDNRLENLRWVTYQENMAGFRSNPAAIITKGGMCKKKSGSWEWHYRMKGKQKTKTMKSKAALEKYKDEILKKYLI